ncbi:hypothetical protein DTQ70_25755 [Runella sp. SP2]|nr:hypothetical protein DTQ70_25755 [Runella sp. SP2]
MFEQILVRTLESNSSMYPLKIIEVSKVFQCFSSMLQIVKLKPLTDTTFHNGMIGFDVRGSVI